jgi:hypothetical protein
VPSNIHADYHVPSGIPFTPSGTREVVIVATSEGAAWVRPADDAGHLGFLVNLAELESVRLGAGYAPEKPQSSPEPAPSLPRPDRRS